MRRLNLVLLASLQLTRARQPGFSIHDDLLAHPQFEVIFSDSYISEPDALALLESNSVPHAAYESDVSRTDLASNVRESAAADAKAGGASGGDDSNIPEISETYEIISSPPSRYLCSVPAIAQSAELNQTATELAKAEEARELSRASAKGWELMSGLEGHCLYFMSGWWSYSFCYGRDIVQFHAVPSGANGGPPVKDPNSQEYVLGTSYPPQKPHGGQRNQGNAAQNHAGTESNGVAPPNTELQVKGDQRYLVQRLDGGTLCDLTGRPRTIEIQYHCSLGASVDRIGWIKEVTTCTYLMVVQTPRLCADVAFLPPKETRAHPINCRPIIRDDEELAAWHWHKTVEAKKAMGILGAQPIKAAKDAARQNPFAGMTIGGIVVGGKRVLGSGPEGEAPVELTPPRGLGGGKSVGSTLAEKLSAGYKKGDGGAMMEVLTPEELEEMGVDQETIEVLRKELRRLGGDDAWEIAVEVIPAQGEETFGAGESEDDEGGAATGGRRQTRQPTGQGQRASNSGKKPGTRDGKTGGNGNKDGGEDEDAGSQEVFKDEL